MGESFKDVRACRKFPFVGVAKPDGTVELEAKTGVVVGCERVLALNLRPGNRLTGAVWGPGGKFDVRVTRSPVAPSPGDAEKPYGWDRD